MIVELLVEGFTDEVFVRRCYGELGIEVGTVFGKKGVGYLSQKAQGFAARGQYSPLLVLADFMDIEGICPPEASALLVPHGYEQTLVCLAVNEIESWLLASRNELARFFGVSSALLPHDPDEIADPKLELINLARRSPRTRIRKMFVPRQGASSVVGEGYVDGFSEFLSEHWILESAERCSPSFSRFVRRSRQVFLESDVLPG